MNSDLPLSNLKGSEIAVVGMAGRFPGAQNVDAFWRNVRDGVEAITSFTDEQLRAEGVEEAALHTPTYVKAGMVLDEMEMFDAGFFGFSPRDAAIMDPQHRHFLEVSWEALEHAGYDSERFEGAIGVFGGSGGNFYMPYNLLTNPDLMKSLGLFMVRHTGNDKDFLTTRVSYLLNLRGPSINVQTACSTSLVAVHLASQSLLHFECDMALAGGVTIEMPHRHGYFYQEGEILSPDGHCRTFDADSKGTIFGSGVGVLALRRLEDALKDGDTIHAVILGSAINNDGAGKMNYFAPSIDGQAAVIAEALGVADVSADEISYVETHGTGTPIGDPIEVAALTQAFRATSSRSGYCGIGSVKTNIGHLDTAAGVASLIKVVQALKHRQLPPSLNFQRPNPAIDFDRSPFYVQTTLEEWRTEHGPRRAGVSSLGVGGTNAHIILEEAPLLEPSARSEREWQLLTLSAKSPAALDKATQRLADYLEEHPEINLADVAYTLQLGRRAFAHRRILACRDHADAVATIRAADSKRLISGQVKANAQRVAFMFPGGGAQYVNMGRDLYDQEPIYRSVVDECLALIQPQLPFDLKSLMYPVPSSLEAASAALEKPLAGLVALFITEYAMARLWMAWGIQPAAMTGHSMGEYTAACLAGVMSLRDALAIVALRGRLFESLPEGGMLSIPLSEAEVTPLLVAGASVSVINSATTCVVSGNLQAIAAMEETLLARGIECRRVKIAVAAHSPMLDGILDEFYQHLARLPLQRATLPFISNLSGTWVDADEAATPRYWVNHLRHTVRFGDGLATLMESGDYLLLEVGPGNTLGSLARQHPNKPATLLTLASMRHPRESVPDMQVALTTLGRLWLAGQLLDWQLLHGQEERRRVPLPTYPFEHQRYWIEPGKQTFSAETKQTSLTKLPNLDDWFYQPVWRRADLQAPAQAQSPQRWLLFTDTVGMSAAVAALLEKAGHEVITVAEGRHYAKTGNHSYTLNPLMREHYFDLVEDLVESSGLPQRIMHLWGVTPQTPIRSRIKFYEKSRDNLFYSLLFFTQAISKENRAHPLFIGVISNGMQLVADEGLPYPEKAMLLGPCKVIPREFPDIACRSIDIALPKQGLLGQLLSRDAAQMKGLAQRLVAECSLDSTHNVVAYRNSERWIQEFEPAPPQGGLDRLRERGVYLITGGLGGIGLTLAEYLAKTVKARLILLARTKLPKTTEWDSWLATHPIGDKRSRLIRKIREMEMAGAEVMVANADLNDRDQLHRVLEQAWARFGALHGLIHAAGTIDDSLIQLKSAGAAAHVLAPKVRGTLLLDELLHEGARAASPLDFAILMSSTSSILGPAGQVDYVAANAFLDAFAQSKIQSKTTYTVSLNWGMWQEVGMAANASTNTSSQNDKQRTSKQGKSNRGLNKRAAAKTGHHPLLHQRLSHTDKEIRYVSHYSPQTEWILDQHRLRHGEAVMPGTGYLELARAAVQNGHGPQPVEIQNLAFMTPLQVSDVGEQEVHVSLHKNGGGYDFLVSSRPNPDGAWQEHVTGIVRVNGDTANGNAVNGNAASERLYPLAEIAARCHVKQISFQRGEQFTQQEAHLLFGPRWKVLREARFGEGEALALLELPQEFLVDLEAYSLHPALLDLATGYCLPLVQGYEASPDLYVPLSYGRVSVHRSLPSKIYSYARLKGTQNETVAFDIDIVDEDGRLLVSIHDFVMKRLRGPQQLLAASSSQQERGLSTSADGSGEAGKLTLLQIGMTRGIRPAEGIEIFQRVLSGDSAPQRVATSLSMEALFDFVNSRTQETTLAPKFTRPNLASEYAPARDDLEAKLVAIWEDALGIQQIGIHDDFFDLGGESLVAIRLLSQIRKKFAVDLPLSIFFQAPTIAQGADRLRAEVAETSDTESTPRKRRPSRLSSLVPMQPNGSRVPLFLVHGMHGNIMIFSVLTDYLGLDQPVYGLQAQGVDGKSKPQTRIEDMAALYIQEMRELRPHGPYVLGGYSSGGEIAFEMAQQLTAVGEEVRLVVMFDTLNPNRAVRVSSFSQQPVIQGATAPLDKASILYRRVMGYANRLSRLKPQEQLAYIRKDINFRAERVYLDTAVRIAQARGHTLSFELIEKQLAEANIKAVANYVPSLYPGRIALFRASESLETNPSDDPMGWSALAKGGVDEYIIEGGHALVTEPYVVEVVSHLTTLLDEIQDGIQDR